jgi:HSP20 family protein
MIRGMISRNTVSTKNSKGGFKMKLVRWTPMHNIVSSFARDLDRNFNDDWFRFPTNRTWDRSWSPVVDVEERENEIVLNAELPGMKKSDIEITIEENHLTLHGEKKSESKNGDEGSDYFRSERFFGKFERSFHLPTYVAADEAQASFKNGILQVILPKKEDAKSKKITIS